MWEHTVVMPPTMAMMTEVIAEMTASIARPMAEMIEPYITQINISEAYLRPAR